MELAKNPDNIPLEDLKSAYEIVHASSYYYPSEFVRQSTMLNQFQDSLNCIAAPTTYHVDGHSVEPDMNHRVPHCGVYTRRRQPIVLNLIGEWRNHFGSGGCDPVDEAAKIFESLAVASTVGFHISHA